MLKALDSCRLTSFPCVTPLNARRLELSLAGLFTRDAQQPLLRSWVVTGWPIDRRAGVGMTMVPAAVAPGDEPAGY